MWCADPVRPPPAPDIGTCAAAPTFATRPNAGATGAPPGCEHPGQQRLTSAEVVVGRRVEPGSKRWTLARCAALC
jgi:hypothetical protein